MIKCEICNQSLATVNWLHLRTHNITVNRYKEAFPDAPIHSEETKQAISEGGKGKARTAGHKLSKEHKQKISKASKSMWQRLGFRELMSLKHKGGNRNQKLSMARPEVKERISVSRKKYFQDPEHKRQFIERQLRVMSTPEARRNNAAARTGKPLSMEHRKSIAYGLQVMPNREEWVTRLNKRMREWWTNEENKRRGVEAIMEANHLRPNKTEAYILSILGGEWQYTGDGSLIISGKCPDFWNGDHKVIELFGDYWHQGQNPQDRIGFFKQHGYDCLVIWEHELADENKVKQTILDFTQPVVGMALRITKKGGDKR